jgi:hypothetical protein
VTEQERINRGYRATQAFGEFIEPMLDELRATYSARLIEVANTELSPSKRANKITALSNAMKILNTLEAGMAEMIRDGEMAKADRLKAEKIEKMTAPQRRLLGIAPY